MRLIIVVEGQTEEAFVTDLLKPHFLTLGIYATPTIVGTPKRRGPAPLQKGGGDWNRWRRDLSRILGEKKGKDVRITTLFNPLHLSLTTQSQKVVEWPLPLAELAISSKRPPPTHIIS